MNDSDTTVTRLKMRKFAERQIAVTMTGAQWTILLAKLTNAAPLSGRGKLIAKEAERLLTAQLDQEAAQ